MMNRLFDSVVDRLFDRERIDRCGASLRDLIVFAALFASIMAVFATLTTFVNLLFPAWPIKYPVPSMSALIYLVSLFLSVILGGLLGSLIARGPSRKWAQAIVIFFFAGGVPTAALEDFLMWLLR